MAYGPQLTMKSMKLNFTVYTQDANFLYLLLLIKEVQHCVREGGLREGGSGAGLKLIFERWLLSHVTFLTRQNMENTYFEEFSY